MAGLNPEQSDLLAELIVRRALVPAAVKLMLFARTYPMVYAWDLMASACGMIEVARRQANKEYGYHGRDR